LRQHPKTNADERIPMTAAAGVARGVTGVGLKDESAGVVKVAE